MPTVVAASTSPGPMTPRRAPNDRGASLQEIVVADSSVLKRSPSEGDRSSTALMPAQEASIPDRFHRCRSPWTKLSAVNPIKQVGLYRLMPIGQRFVMSKQPTLTLLDRKSTRLNSSHANISYA